MFLHISLAGDLHFKIPTGKSKEVLHIFVGSLLNVQCTTPRAELQMYYNPRD